ncbi:MAG TPA: hypothetical protein VF101_17420, partial [Gaiellaceae bacterium]
LPATIVCGVLFSVLGDGASQRAGNVTLFAWFVFSRCALDSNGKCTSSADRVTESGERDLRSSRSSRSPGYVVQ